MTIKPFGFRSEFHSPDYDGDDEGWKVTLPHQCDEWAITAASCYDSPVPIAVAVARVESFIAEATECLDALRRGEEFGLDRH